MIWFEPTDVKKATKAFKSGGVIDFASPNLNELRAITGTNPIQPTRDSDPTRVILQEAYELSHIAMDVVKTLFVTLGKLGVMVTSKGGIAEPLIKRSNTEHPTTRLYPPPFVSTFVSVSGAGDCFAAGVLAGMLRGLPEAQCVAAGTAAAAMSIASHPTVPQEMKANCIMWDSTAKYQSYPHDV